MFCPQCGTENPDSAQFCGGCGQKLVPAAPVPAPAPVSTQPPTPAQPPAAPVTVTPPPPPGPPQPTLTTTSSPAVPTHLVMAIITTLCCCMPLGIVSLIFASQVAGKVRAGDIAGARKASSRARTWAIVGIIGGLIVQAIAAVVLIAQNGEY